MNIHIGVGGRFHADHMANAFLRAGHRVTVHTSYPKSRFPTVPVANLRSFVAPELIYRSAQQLGFEKIGENAKMVSFGTWLRSEFSRAKPNFTFIWSSFALETFHTLEGFERVLVRDSTHIAHQLEVLRREHETFGIPFKMSRLCLARELEEYRLADSILVLSHFAKRTFVERGISPKKIFVFPLGVNTSLFKPITMSVIKLPLEMIYFGTISLRKGVQYLLEGTKSFSPSHLKLTLVGPVEDSFRPILSRYNHFIHLPAMAHPQLAPLVASNHVYAFPTLEDGFPNSLIQAMASGLVPISTPENGPAEWIEEGVTGFLIEPRNSEAIRERLEKILSDPSILLPMRKNCVELSHSNTWEQYGSLLNAWISRHLGEPSDRARSQEASVHV
jgi:glycosyltransferase involved in cell wall biosynthesis